MSACFHRIATTGRWVQAKTKISVEQSINTRLRVATVGHYRYQRFRGDDLVVLSILPDGIVYTQTSKRNHSSGQNRLQVESNLLTVDLLYCNISERSQSLGTN